MKWIMVLITSVVLLSAGAWAVYARTPIASLMGAHIAVEPGERDLGVVRQSGGPVVATFTVRNTGSDDIVITGTPASCSCTSAYIETNNLKAGESTTLTVTFDPNYHFEDDGRFFRTVAVQSNAEGAAPEAKVWVEVDYDLGKDKLRFAPDQD